MKTINLLPPNLKRRNRWRLIERLINRSLAGLLVALLVYVGSIVLMLKILQSKNSSKIHRLEILRQGIELDKPVEKQIFIINDRLNASRQIKQVVDWPEYLTALSNLTPATIKLKTLSASSSQPMLLMTGEGIDRRAIIEYQLILDASKQFKDVQLTELTSASQSSEVINFAMTLNIE